MNAVQILGKPENERNNLFLHKNQWIAHAMPQPSAAVIFSLPYPSGTTFLNKLKAPMQISIFSFTFLE
jgi:hypothetical protein